MNESLVHGQGIAPSILRRVALVGRRCCLRAGELAATRPYTLAMQVVDDLAIALAAETMHHDRHPVAVVDRQTRILPVIMDRAAALAGAAITAEKVNDRQDCGVEALRIVTCALCIMPRM